MIRFFRNARVDRISPDDIEQFKTSRAQQKSPRTKRKLRPATMNRELACLKAMLNSHIRGGLNMQNSISAVRFLAQDNEQTRILTFDEQGRYLEAASPAPRDIATRRIRAKWHRAATVLATLKKPGRTPGSASLFFSRGADRIRTDA